MTDVGERQRHPNEPDRRVPHRQRDVQHIDLQGVAVPLRTSDARGARLKHFRPPRVVFHRGDPLQRFRRVPDDPAIRRDEGDAPADQRAETIRFLVETRRRRQLHAAAEQVRGHAGLRDQRRLDPIVHLPPHRRRKEYAGDGERDHRRRQRGEEELGLETGADAEWGRRHQGTGSTSL